MMSSLHRTWIPVLLLGVCVCIVYYSRITILKQLKPYIVIWNRSRENNKTLEFPWMPEPCKGHRVSSQVEDILCMKRPKFLADYKNPCWRAEGGTLRCLPYFHTIGGAKAGTTDLHRRMMLHPEVVTINAYKNKETWYWSKRHYGKGGSGNPIKPMSFKKFLDHFNVKEIERTQHHGYHDLITGHSDPMDFTDFYWNHLMPQNDPEAEELLWTTPYLIKHINPGVKLLLILREPVDRLYSYYFFKNNGFTSLDFHKDVIQSIKVWSDCRKSHSERHCLYDFSMNKERMKVALYSSFYSAHLKEWLKVFPREQFLFLRTEDYDKYKESTLKKIYKFLNITALPHKKLINAVKLEKTRVTERKTKAGPMMPETRRILKDLYREPNKELADLIGDQRFAFTNVTPLRLHRRKRT